MSYEMTDLHPELDCKNISDKDKYRNLVFQDFDTIKVSTKTFIVMTNIILNIENLFNFLPITDYILVPKKRGRKKKNEPEDPNKDIPCGSIITLEYQNRTRGVDLKKKKKKNKDVKKRGNYFRNSVTVVMMMENKKINYKVSRNGKFQMTGCKEDEQAEKCVKWFWDYIKDTKDIYTFSNDEDENKQNNLKAIFIPAMRNIDFSLNFLVDREKLDKYFNTYTEYTSLLETSFGYTGVNIKIPIVKHITDLNLKQMRYICNEWINNEYVPYSDYLKMLPEKDSDKKIKKQRYNTFLIFHSGKIIMSGMEESFMRDVYYEFLDIIRECYHFIQEKLETEKDQSD